MSNYYQKRDAKVNIAHALMDLGWKVYGYKKDESDMMTDYYNPANWDGIATKNGFVLVVDNNYPSEGREIKKYNYTKTSFTDRKKIEKLETMTTQNGATPGEEANAKLLIEKIKNKESEGIADFEVIGIIPGHMANPGRSIWHIEKDGKIYDKGNALTKYADIPPSWMFDIKTMKYTDHYKEVREWNQNTNQWEMVDRKLSEEQEKTVNNFKNLLLRFERVVNGMNTCGDGTKETEQAGLEQQQKEGYEKVIKKVTKTVIKPVQKEDTKINLGDVLSFSYHGHYWIVDSIYQNKEGKTCIVYELLGSEKRGYQRLKNGKRYYQLETRLQKEMIEGKVKVYTLQEVEETTEVEKWVKIKANKTQKTNNNKANNTKEETKQAEQPEQEQTQEVKESIINHEITITKDIDTRDNSDLWVVKVVDSLSKEEYKKVAAQFKELKGYYSRFKHGFIFKYDPAEVLRGEQENQEQQEQQEEKQEQTTGEVKEQKNPYEPEKIEEGYIYNCHFKEWKYNIEQLQDIATQYNLPWYNMNDKIGFDCLTPEQANFAKTISDSNESIFFIDAKIKVVDIKQTEQEAEQQAETLLDISTSILIELDCKMSDIEFNQDIKKQYVKKLAEQVKEYKIPITIKLVKYLLDNDLDLFVGVLAIVSTSTIQEAKPNITEQPEQQKEQQKQENQSKYIEKIEKAIESNNNKIERLSGDYLTNTPKRAREQASREQEKENLQNDNLLLEYLKEKAEQNTMTDLEKSITVNTIRHEIHIYYVRKNKYNQDIKYPQINLDTPADGWYNLEVPKMQKRLQKANINNTPELLKAIEEYRNIIITIEQPKNPLKEQIKKRERELKFCKIPGYFPTPKNIVNQMIELAEIEENDLILEPSAGNGNIVDSITAAGYKCDVIEWNYSLKEILQMKGYNIVGDDFLSYSNFNKYDKVIMNPPFSYNSKITDITHVKHAYKMLKNNGKIVAIMSPHFTFANDKESIEFREWLSNRGYYEKLPEGSFKDSGTNINTVIVVIDKLENDMSQTG